MPFLVHRPRPATVALAVIVACQLMFVLDATVVNIALVPIANTLHFSRANLAWVIDAYSLTSVVSSCWADELVTSSGAAASS